MLNKTIVQGRLTRDAELRETQTGKKVASFTVAWSEKYNDTERKLFMPCVAWGKSAEFVALYFKKGSEIIVEGALTSRKWQDQNGNNRETIELIVDKMHFCGAKKTDTPAADALDSISEDEFVEITDDESELPF